MKYRYRKKGKYTDGRIKIVIDKIHKNGLITSMTLPKPNEMWDTLKCPVFPEGKLTTKNHALSEPKVHDDNVKCKYCDKYFLETNLTTKIKICDDCLHDMGKLK